MHETGTPHDHTYEKVENLSKGKIAMHTGEIPHPNLYKRVHEATKK